MSPCEEQLALFHQQCAEWEPDGPPKDPGTCKHENVEHYKHWDGWSGESTAGPCPEGVEFLGCLDCRSLLALELGPANDSGLVMIEIRAAEIAASGHDIKFGSPAFCKAVRMRSMHWFEGCGWNHACPEPGDMAHSACDNGEPEDGPLHQAGYLAAIIVNHAKEQA